jgi:hypothetical protein
LKLTGKTHPKPVIDSLLLCEVSVFLYVLLLLTSVFSAWRESHRQKTLCRAIDDSFDDTETILVTAYDAGYGHNISKALEDLDPIYASSSSTSQSAEEDVQAVSESLRRVSSDPRKDLLRQRMRSLAAYSRAKSVLAAIFTALNAVAWYGYLVAALTFYVDESTEPHLFKAAKLFLSHRDADHWGNLAGDLAWTLEPLVIILLVPLVERLRTPRGVNKKTTGAAKAKVA